MFAVRRAAGGAIARIRPPRPGRQRADAPRRRPSDVPIDVPIDVSPVRKATMLLVVGATGTLGGEICRLLAAEGVAVRALVRPSADPARVEALRALGAELATGDLRDRASLDRACAGATAVISTAASTSARLPDDDVVRTDRDGAMQLVDAARAARVRRLVYVSFTGNMEIPSPFRDAKRDVERYVQASGVPYTILRPSVFMESWISPAAGFDWAAGQARLLGDGDRPVSWISVHDVARFAVDCVGDPAARDRVIELGGPEALTATEVVHTFEIVAGRPFAVTHVPEDALAGQWRAAEHPLEKSFAALMLGVARGDAIDMRGTLAVFPRRMTRVRDYAERVLRH